MNPNSLFQLWFPLRRPVSQAQYFIGGLVLMALKYLGDAAPLYFLEGVVLSPLNFLNPTLTGRAQLTGDPALLLFMAAWSLPFLWIGLSMSVRRALDAGYSPWWAMLFLMPGVNLCLMLWLSIAPRRQDTSEILAKLTIRGSSDSKLSIVGILQSGAIAVAIALIMTIFSVYLLKSYGAALFVGTPFLIGIVIGVRASRIGITSGFNAAFLAALSVLFVGGALLLFAFEGVICLVMAMPLALVISAFGAVFGFYLTPFRHRELPLGVGCLAIFAFIEPLTPLQRPVEFEVLSSIEIAAPPDLVWQHVVGFSEIPSPPNFLMKLGIAYPLRARIEGHGVGAVRYCEFSTGPFVEPITIWEPPRRLAFSVSKQPPPMTELSPYRALHPPHLDNTIRSQRGEFRLIPMPQSKELPEGGTRLEGRTWYTLPMYPQGYWRFWSDEMIHQIHRRVLGHIKGLSEGVR